MNMSGKTIESGLTRISVMFENPCDLFNEWYTETKKYANFAYSEPNAMSCSSVDSDGKVHNRYLMLRGMKGNNFLIMTDNRSDKCTQLATNPNVALAFHWVYIKENTRFSRQVRIEGVATQLCKEKTQELYEGEPLYCKIRSYVCHQDTVIDWEKLKQNHDKVLREVEAGKQLPMPDHFVAYEIIPENIEFYSTEGHTIADRVRFTKALDNNWTHCHISA